MAGVVAGGSQRIPTCLDPLTPRFLIILVLDVDEDYQKKNQEKTDEDDGQRDDNLHRILLNARVDNRWRFARIIIINILAARGPTVKVGTVASWSIDPYELMAGSSI